MKLGKGWLIYIRPGIFFYTMPLNTSTCEMHQFLFSLSIFSETTT